MNIKIQLRSLLPQSYGFPYIKILTIELLYSSYGAIKVQVSVGVTKIFFKFERQIYIMYFVTFKPIISFFKQLPQPALKFKQFLSKIQT